jgi:hypothetical protein
VPRRRVVLSSSLVANLESTASLKSKVHATSSSSRRSIAEEIERQRQVPVQQSHGFPPRNLDLSISDEAFDAAYVDSFSSNRVLNDEAAVTPHPRPPIACSASQPLDLATDDSCDSLAAFL